MSDGGLVGISVVLLFLNAFFVGAEFALISARRTNIEPMAASGSRAAKITLGAMENVSLMMAGAQLGITICSLGLGSLGEPAVAHLLEDPFGSLRLPDDLLHPISFVIALAIVVFLHVVIGEMVPKNIALAGPDRSALILAPPLVLIVKVLRPAIWLLNAIANLTLRAFGVQPKNEVTSAFTRDEVAGLVSESRREGLLDIGAEKLLTDALTFSEREVLSVLLPIDELQTVPPRVTPREIEVLSARTGFSRFPVRTSDGELTGYLHLKDVLSADPAGLSTPVPDSLIRPMSDVDASASLRDVLSTMQRSGSHLARVHSEGAGMLGVVALEDVLEELVGEVRDEIQASGNTTKGRTGIS